MNMSVGNVPPQSILEQVNTLGSDEEKINYLATEYRPSQRFRVMNQIGGIAQTADKQAFSTADHQVQSQRLLAALLEWDANGQEPIAGAPAASQPLASPMTTQPQAAQPPMPGMAATPPQTAPTTSPQAPTGMPAMPGMPGAAAPAGGMPAMPGMPAQTQAATPAAAAPAAAAPPTGVPPTTAKKATAKKKAAPPTAAAAATVAPGADLAQVLANQEALVLGIGKVVENTAAIQTLLEGILSTVQAVERSTGALEEGMPLTNNILVLNAAVSMLNYCAATNPESWETVYASAKTILDGGAVENGVAAILGNGQG